MGGVEWSGWVVQKPEVRARMETNVTYLASLWGHSLLSVCAF